MGARAMARLLATIIFIWASSGVSAVAGTTAGLLAVSWQPAFCEGHSDKRECRTQTAQRYDASHFSLHGLWPMGKNYCGVNGQMRRIDEAGRWSGLPALDLQPDTRIKLEWVMPGTLSGLHRHEWIKHGTCSDLSQESYFRRSIELTDALNASPVAALFASNIGAYLSAMRVREAFEEAFGAGGADGVKMRCIYDGNRKLISEFTIGLSKAYIGDEPLGVLVGDAGKTGFGCDGGIVDPAGLQ